MPKLTRSQRRARKTARVADARRNPGRGTAAPVIVERARDENGEPITLVTALDANPNRAKRGASPTNWNARTIAPSTIRQPTAALVVATPLRTPTGRIARKGGRPEYSRYTIGTNYPLPVPDREDS